MIFGAQYESSAVVPDGTAPPAVANPITDYVPSARPGGRAPHVGLERDGQRLSTIDLFGNGFVLLTTPAGKAWHEAAQRLGIKAFSIGDGGLADPEGLWTTANGVDEAGAVLVRPDGYVGWRSRAMTGHPEASLSEAMTSILSRLRLPSSAGEVAPSYGDGGVKGAK
jgi:hypothetical protein